MSDYALDVVYFLVAMCCVYKLAWIARQVGEMPGLAPHALRAACLILGLIMLGRAAVRFMTYDPAEWIDCLRELAWCGFLAAAIAVLRRPAGRL
jgi:hypothetical protein